MVSIPSAEAGSSKVLAATSYDPYTLQGNADLGAKILKYLYCYYSFWGKPTTTTATAILQYAEQSQQITVDWYYQQAKLPYPDSSLPNSLCAPVFNQNSYYPALPSTTSAAVELSLQRDGWRHDPARHHGQRLQRGAGCHQHLRHQQHVVRGRRGGVHPAVRERRAALVSVNSVTFWRDASISGDNTLWQIRT